MADFIARWLEWIGCAFGGHIWKVPKTEGHIWEFECVYCKKRKRIELPSEIFKE